MSKNKPKTLHAYLGNRGELILKSLSEQLMLSKSGVIRLALSRLMSYYQGSVGEGGENQNVEIY
jgi:hypothetical protein